MRYSACTSFLAVLRILVISGGLCAVHMPSATAQQVGPPGSSPPAAALPPTAAPKPDAPIVPAPVAQPTGTLVGTIVLPSGAPLKFAAVYVGEVPTSAWSVPKHTAVISQRGARFQPEFLVVPVGQTVDMPNDDRITHNVFSVSPPKRFDLGHYPQGEKRSVRFDKPGIVELYCNIHENMQATVLVAPSTFFARPNADGQYRIAELPVGKYPVTAYSPDGGSTTLTVEISANKTTTLNLTFPRG